MRKAFITGITGQDGRHLAEFLQTKGYKVYGMMKGQHNPRAELLRDEFPEVEVVPGDLTDLTSLVTALEYVQPDEFYNLGAISFVAMSFNQAELTANVTGLGVLRALEAVRMVGGAQNNPIRFYQASSSEMFGKVRQTPQTELTPFHPRSPYGVAKVFGHDITVNYRESYGMYACSGILFNHEGPRRYVKAMWMMLQQDAPDDYVIATGETHSVDEFLTLAFEKAGLGDFRKYVKHDPKFFRPAEVDLLIGDPSKAEKKLGWKREVGFDQLVDMMVQHDIAYETNRLKNI